MVIKINKVGKHIDKSFSHKYYDEIGLGIDFTARDIQSNLKEKGHPWEKSKAFDNSCMVGNFLKKEKIEDISKIEFSLKKNNEVVQSGCSNDMLWKIDELISYVSQYFTLKIGDLIFTGTPSGVSKVESGDILEGYISSFKMFTLKVKVKWLRKYLIIYYLIIKQFLLLKVVLEVNCHHLYLRFLVHPKFLLAQLFRTLNSPKKYS